MRLLIVNDCFYDKHNEVVDFIGKYSLVLVGKPFVFGSLIRKRQRQGFRSF
jgi:hypothetical protein